MRLQENKVKIVCENEQQVWENVQPNLSGFEPKLIKLEFIIYLPKLKVLDDLLTPEDFYPDF